MARLIGLGEPGDLLVGGPKGGVAHAKRAEEALVEEFFFGTATMIEGVGLNEIATEAVSRHKDAFSDAPVYRRFTPWKPTARTSSA